MKYDDRKMNNRTSKNEKIEYRKLLLTRLKKTSNYSLNGIKYCQIKYLCSKRWFEMYASSR